MTPQSSVLSLPLQDDDNASSDVAIGETAQDDASELQSNIQNTEVKDDSDSAETEVLGGRGYRKQDTSTASTADHFLERLSNSSRSSLNGSDHMQEELAALGIYDSELLAEDALTGTDSENDDDWEEHEIGNYGETASPMVGMLGGDTGRGRRRKKWKEAEDELQRGGNRSLLEVRSTASPLCRRMLTYL